MSEARWTGKALLALGVCAAASWAAVTHLLPLPPAALWALAAGVLVLGEALWLLADRQAAERENRLLRRGLQRLRRRTALLRSRNDWFLTGGRSRLTDVQAGADAPREYYTGLLSSLTSTQVLPRLHVLAGPVGSGRSTLLLRLGQALADRGETVLRALPAPDLDFVQLVLQEASLGRPVYLLLDDLDTLPQAPGLLYELLRSGAPVVVIAALLDRQLADGERDLLEALEPADLLALATVHDIQVTPNDLGALITKLGALSRLERTQVAGEGSRSYLSALEHLQGEAFTSRFWERGEALGPEASALVTVALAGAAEVALPVALFPVLVPGAVLAPWERAGLVARECGLVLPPHQATCLTLLARGGDAGPAVRQALEQLLRRAQEHVPALGPRLLCGLGRVPRLRPLAREVAEACQDWLPSASLSPDLGRLWQYARQQLDLAPESRSEAETYPPARAGLAGELLRRGQYAAALDLYDQLRADHTYGELARFNSALALAHLESYEEAEEQLAQLARPLPGRHYLRGVIAEKRGDLVTALDCYESSRKADEVTLPATRRLALTYLRSGAPRAAIPLLEAMLGFTPLRADLYGALAAAHLHAGVTQRAGAQSARAIQAGVEPNVARRAVARAFRDVNAFDRMAGELETAVRYDPEDAEAWDELAQACHWLGRFEREEHSLNELRRCLGGQAEPVRLRLARCYRDQGRPGEALELLQPLLERADTTPDAFVLAAQVAGACGHKHLQGQLASAALSHGDETGWGLFWWADSQAPEAPEVAESYRGALARLEARAQGSLTPRQAATLWQAIHVVATRLGETALADRALKLSRQEAMVCKAIGSEVESVTARRSVPADVFIGELTPTPPPASPPFGPETTPRPANGVPSPPRPAPLPNRYQQRGQTR